MSLFKTLFDPLGPEYCNFFIYVSIFSFIILIFSALYVASTLFNKKKIGFAQTMILLFQPLLLYFVNRLYYSMCVNSMSKN